MINYNRSPLPRREEEMKSDLPCILRSRLTLQPHQIHVVAHMSQPNVHGLLVVHDVGSGKTLTAVAASQCFLDESLSHRVIIVTPKSLQYNFKKEIVAYGADPKDPRYLFFTITGFTNAIKKGMAFPFANCMLIVDEVHNIRTQQDVDENYEDIKEEEVVGVYAKNLILAARKSKKVLLLTATPLINRTQDIINLITMVDGGVPITAKELYTIDLRAYMKCKVSVYQPPEEYRRDNYPSTVTHDVVIPMNRDYLQQYMDIENNADLRAFYTKIRQAANTLEMQLSQKVNWVLNKLQNSAPSEKFVVYSNYIESGLRLLMKQVEDRNITYKYVTGELSKEQRADAVRLYNEDEIKILFISKAGGEGLDLKNTAHVVLMEPTWNESSNRQIIGRAVRYKSHERLPIEQRVVHVHRLYLAKPSEIPYVQKIFRELITYPSNDGVKLSIDLYLRNYSIKKQMRIDMFMDYMTHYSIENQNC